MDVFATSASPVITGVGVGTGASKYTDLVTKYVNDLASGSKASIDDQLNAYQNIQSLLFTGDDNGGVLYQANKNDLRRAVDAFENSDMAKRIQQLDRQYNSFGFAASFSAGNPDTFNLKQNQLDNLSRFSPDEQKIIFVSQQLNIHGALTSGGKPVYYENLEDWKADLKKQAAVFAAQPTVSSEAATAATATKTEISAGNQNTAKVVGKAAALLPKSGAALTNASIALQVLLKTQDKTDVTASTQTTKGETVATPNHPDLGTATALDRTSKADLTFPDTRIDRIA